MKNIYIYICYHGDPSSIVNRVNKMTKLSTVSRVIDVKDAGLFVSFLNKWFQLIYFSVFIPKI